MPASAHKRARGSRPRLTPLAGSSQVQELIQIATPRSNFAPRTGQLVLPRSSPASTPLAQLSSPPDPLEANATSGGVTPRSRKLGAELEELRRQLDALRNENRELKLQTGGELSADEDEKTLQVAGDRRPRPPVRHASRPWQCLRPLRRVWSAPRPHPEASLTRRFRQLRSFS